MCGGRGKQHAVECHEEWTYDDEAHVQTLVRMVALCPACHSVKHIGRAQQIGLGDEAKQRLAEVNGWTVSEASAYIRQAFATWRERSRHDWTLSLDALRNYLPDVELPT